MLEVPGIAELAAAAESELSDRALVDRDRCCGYFPALAGAPGIVADLPACQEFAAELPQLEQLGDGVPVQLPQAVTRATEQ